VQAIDSASLFQREVHVKSQHIDNDGLKEGIRNEKSADWRRLSEKLTAPQYTTG
jgi:hypothetical protein